jgi:hypothetical protein
MKLTETEFELALALKSDELINTLAELDNERQYQVGMEDLWAHDREVISNLRSRVEELEEDLADGSFYKETTIDALIDRAEQAEAKLAKAVEALKNIAHGGGYTDMQIARAMLAELEGK